MEGNTILAVFKSPLLLNPRFFKVRTKSGCKAIHIGLTLIQSPLGSMHAEYADDPLFIHSGDPELTQGPKSKRLDSKNVDFRAT